MTWSPEDRERFLAAQEQDRRLRTSRFQAAAVGGAAVVAILAAAFLAGRADDWRRRNRLAVEEVTQTHRKVATIEKDLEELRAERDELRTAFGEHVLATAQDGRRLAGIDEQLEAAGFETVTEAIEHGTVHHGQIRACSASLSSCREWLGWSVCGFWRPDTIDGGYLTLLDGKEGL